MVEADLFLIGRKERPLASTADSLFQASEPVCIVFGKCEEVFAHAVNPILFRCAFTLASNSATRMTICGMGVS